MSKSLKENANPCSIFLNILIGIIRMFIFFHLIRLSWGLLFYYQHFTFTGSCDAFVEYYLTIFLFAVISLCLYDSVCGGTSMIARGSFAERQKLGGIIHTLGFGGSYLDIFLYRILLLSTLSMDTQARNINYLKFYGIVSNNNIIPHLNYLFHDLPFYISVGAYVFLSILCYPLFSRFKSFNHPYMSAYSEDPPTVKMKTRFYLGDIILFILNIAIKIFVYIVFLYRFKTGAYKENVWDNDYFQIMRITVGFVVIPLLICREIYMLLRYNRYEGIYAAYIFDFGFVLYLLFSIHNYSEASKDKIYLWLLVAGIVLNLICYVGRNRHRSLNLLLYFLKKVTSQRFFAALLIMLSYVYAASGFMLHSKYFGQQWFLMDATLHPVLQAVVDAIKSILDFFKSILEAIQFSFMNLGGIVGCVILVAAMAAAIALAFIPFGFGGFGYGIALAMTIARMVRDLVSKTSRTGSNSNAMDVYGGKADGISSLSAVPVLGYLSSSILVSAISPVLLGFTAVYVLFWERFTSLSKLQVSLFGFIIIAMNLSFVSIILLVKYIIVREINLGLVVVHFFPTINLTMTILAFISATASIFALFGHLVLADNSEITEIKTEEKTQSSKTESSKIESAESVVLEAGERIYDTYLLKDLKDSICRCGNRVYADEPPSHICKLIVKNLSPCTKVEDRRTVCKFESRRMFPCQHDDGPEEEDLFRRNTPLNCCCYELECDMNDKAIKKYFDFNGLGRIAEVNPYLILVGAAFYLLYKVSDPLILFYETKTNMGLLLIAILGDSGVDATDNQLKAQNEEQAAMCSKEFATVLGIFLRPLISKLEETNPEFKKLMDLLRQNRNMHRASSFTILFNIVAKFILCWPIVAGGIIIVGVIIFTSFRHDFSIRMNGLALSFMITVTGLLNLIGFQSTVNALFKLIPFIELSISQDDGYGYALYAFMLVLLANFFFGVDIVAPHVVARRPLNLEEQMEAADNDLMDPLYMDIRQAELRIGQSIVGPSDRSFPFDS